MAGLAAGLLAEFQTVRANIAGVFNQLGTDLSDFASNVKSTATGFASFTANLGAVRSAVSLTKMAFGGISSGLKSVGGAASQVGSGLIAAAGRISSAAGAIRDRISAAFNGSSAGGSKSSGPDKSWDTSGLSAVAGAVGTAVVGTVTQLAGSFGRIKSTILETVGAFRPFEVELFGRAVKDLQAVFGQMLLPVLQAATRVVRELANYFYSLPDSVKNVIGAVTKVALVITGIAAAAVGLGSIAAMLAPLVSVPGAIIAALGGLLYIFSQTSGGAKFLQDALQYVEQAIAGLAAVGKEVWAQLAPMRAQLADAFSDLGSSLSKFLEATKPLAAFGFAAIGAAIKVGLQIVIGALTNFANQLRILADRLTTFLKQFGVKLNLKLPDVNREDKSAYGLGQHGGTISSDVAGMKTKFEEMILANTGAGGGDTEEKGPEVELGDIKTVMEDIETILREMPAQIVSGIVSGLLPGISKKDSDSFSKGFLGGMFPGGVFDR